MESGDNQTQNTEQQNGTSSDEDSRKLFVGALPPTATKDDLQTYFETYGEVEVCTIKTDVYTGRSRGFGFVIFKDVSAVDGVLKAETPHNLCGKQIDPKLATPQAKSEPAKNSKIFVGGLDSSVTKEEIEEAFKVKGNVMDVYLPINRETGEPKNFAFVNFDDKAIADELCDAGKFVVGKKECDIKRANNKNDRGGFRGGRGFRGGFRGRGGYGGRGGYYQGGYDGGYAGGYNGGYAVHGYGAYGGADYNGGGHYAANYGAYDQNQYTAGY